MKNIILFLLISLNFSFTFAAPKIPDANLYQSGRQLCEVTYVKMLPHEKGFYTTVPVNYKNPAAGTTDIYAFFAGGIYDQTKPTIIYFNGGPGQPSHWGLSIEGAKFNVLLMDQRGIACSRPSSWSQLMSPEFYSSENVARDAEVIRQKLNLGVVSAYGVSYGTIPATIYGNLFPQVTRSVILEGIIYKTDNELWSSSYRRQMLQKMIASFSANVLELLEQVSAVYKVDSRWFYVLASDLMGSSEGYTSMKEYLGSIEPDFVPLLVKKVGDYFEEMQVEPHILFLGNDIPYYMIACQEMGMATPGLSTQDTYSMGKLTPQPNTVDVGFCAQINASTKSIYEAKKYPLSVPVYYFQGEEDFQTPLPQAQQHFASVPQAAKTMLVMKEGGHNPNMSQLRGESAAQLEMFKLAILGKEIPKNLLEEFNKENPKTTWDFYGKSIK